MPLYEYVCRDCDKPSELLVRAQESPECPHCGGAKLAKLLSVPAAHTMGQSGGPPEGPAGSCGSGCACFPEG